MHYLCAMKSIYRLLLTLLALPLLAGSGYAQCVHQPKHEYRAVWLTTIKGLDWPHEETRGDYRKQKEDLCRVLDSLQAININTILRRNCYERRTHSG